MILYCCATQPVVYFSNGNGIDVDAKRGLTCLTPQELGEIIEYTIQKINNYPKSFGKTVENYFDLLFPDEVKNYLRRRSLNEKHGSVTDARHRNGVNAL